MLRSGAIFFRTLLLLVVALALGAWAGVYWVRMHAGSVPAGAAITLAEISPGAAHPQLYVCPMHSQIVRDHPDHCPICGMALVPLAVHDPAVHDPAMHDPAMHDPTVTINAAVSNDLSVRVAAVERRDIVRRATLPAYVQVFTPGYTQAVRATLGGTLAHVVASGSRVHAGDALFEVQVAGALSAQQAYIALLQNKDEMAIASARNKLRELGMTGDDIAALEAAHTPVDAFKTRTTLDGRVANLALHSGDAVHPGDTVLVVQGAGATTVDVDVFQTEALWLQTGDRAELHVRQFPGRVWVGQSRCRACAPTPKSAPTA
jgi:Cu(I)/Ag(I) efflux system membrane fusion protein